MTVEKESKNCRFCNTEFIPKTWNNMCCSTRCSNLWRYRNPANSVPAIKYRGANYRNFLMSLRTKLSQRRDLDIEFLCRLYEDQEGRCAISGKIMTFVTGMGMVPTNISIDRIDPLKGYEEDNVRLVCRQANTMKMLLSDNELIEWCKSIIETNDKRKKK